MLTHQFKKGASIFFSSLRGTRNIAVARTQQSFYEAPLKCSDNTRLGGVERLVHAVHWRHAMRQTKVVDKCCADLSHQHSPFDNMLELPDIAGPIMGKQLAQRTRR